MPVAATTTKLINGKGEQLQNGALYINGVPYYDFTGLTYSQGNREPVFVKGSNGQAVAQYDNFIDMTFTITAYPDMVTKLQEGAKAASGYPGISGLGQCELKFVILNGPLGLKTEILQGAFFKDTDANYQSTPGETVSITGIFATYVNNDSRG